MSNQNTNYCFKNDKNTSSKITAFLKSFLAVSIAQIIALNVAFLNT